MNTIRELKKYGIELLDKNNIDDSVSIVNILLEYCFDINKKQIILQDNKFVTEREKESFLECINRRINNEPLEYITNKKMFMNSEIFVNENVLIPRYDTEILIENLLEIINKEYVGNDEIKILELCTGSGCIPVGALNYIKEKNFYLFNKINFVCVDISEKALEVAKINIEKYNLQNKIKLIKSDLFENIANVKFNIILSNPPYIETKIIDSLNNDVKNEPLLALDGGEDGLHFYREISKSAKKYLKNKGYLLYEIGYNQADTVSKILEDNKYTDIIVKKDLSGNNRNVIAKN